MKNPTPPMTSSLPSPFSSSAVILLMLLFFLAPRVESTTFTLVNNCGYTIWPGILSNSGSPALDPTGFTLLSGASRSLLAPTGWSGRFWARTSCSPDASGRFLCGTGDCGSGALECDGSAASPPATLAEFTLAASGGNDFYDVSLVDGYNLPLVVTTVGGQGGCATTGCAVELNRVCPMELRVKEGDACRSACDAFGRPEFCCSGVFGTPSACRPSVYSEVFKSACPNAYSYAYDDATSTFTCSGADYSITFCPEATHSLKSSSQTSPSPPNEVDEIFVEEDSWFARLAMGDTASGSARRISLLYLNVIISAALCILLLCEME